PNRQIGVSAAGGPEWGAFRVSGAFEGDPAAYDIPAVTWADDYRRWKLRVSGSAHPARNVALIVNLARVSSNLRLPMYAPLEAGLLGPSDSAGFTWSQGMPNSGTQSVGRTLASLEGRARPA